MKKIILISLLALIYSVTVNAQLTTCVPDELYRDSTFGVYPPPVSPTNLDGGIPISACRNMPWEFAITVKIPEEIIYQGTPIALFGVDVEQTDAVKNLPTGFTYSCTPPDCIFEPSDTLGCINVYGITSDTVGMYDIKIQTKIRAAIFPTGFDIELPSNLIDGAAGNYYIKVVDENDPECFVSNVDVLLAEKFQVRNLPNPFGTFTNIEIRAEENDELEFRVYDIYGKLIHSQDVGVFTGMNSFQFDGSDLANGVYVYTLGKDGALISDKMIINR